VHGAGNEGVVVGLSENLVNAYLGGAECDDVGCARDVPVERLMDGKTRRKETCQRKIVVG